MSQTVESLQPTVMVERSAKAIRAVLSPEQRSEFEAEFHIAMAEADDDFDLTRVDAVLDRWWHPAIMAANPEYYAAMIRDHERIKAGDYSQVSEHHPLHNVHD